MYRNMFRFFTILVVSMVCSLTIFGQASSLSGAVVDPTDDVIPGASVMIKNMTTGAEFKAATASNGTFSIPALDPGTYTVTITAPGFKQAVVKDVKVDASVPASVRVSLEVGNANESVVVQGGGEIVQTQSATVSTTINVNQVMNLPLVSRNAVNFIVFLPGVDTPGLNRDATINGLPENAINITIDGINAQDNFNKTTDGNFARVSPRLDAVQEVTVTTAASGAGDSGSGAAQIKFVTRQGSNELHGSVYEYHRNPFLNSNYWFSNRDSAPIHSETGLTCGTAGQPYEPGKCRAARARVLTNQYGFRVGGPISIPKLFDGRDRAFFFVNYEEFRLPNASNEQRTIFSPSAQSGTFRYIRTVNGQQVTESVDLLAMAARNGQTSTIDPTIGKLLADIRGTTSQGQVTQLTDPNLQRFNFTTPGNNVTYFPTVRLDFNLTEKHHLEATWNYQKLYSTPDFLNNRDPSYPGFPNAGSQIGDRFTGSVALRSTLSSTIVNEVRGGMSGGPSRFNPETSVETFSGSLANQGGFTFGSATGTGGLFDAAGINNPSSTTAPSRRNPLLKNISDTVTWTRGAHSFSFGGEFSQYDLTLHSRPLLAPNLSFGVNSNDPAIAMFTTANFPGAANADITRAQGIYAALTGRITAITANAVLDEQTNKYVYLGESVNRGRQRQYGVFAQDSWRMRPNLTVNYGLRWEVQGPFSPTNSGYTTVTVDDLYGVSGPGNLFKPGVQTGRVTQFIEFKPGDKAYNVDYTNFAPNFGFAWTPNVRDGLLSRILGGSGRTVIRGGYAIAYNRNGLGDFSGTFGSNPGSSINATRSYTIGNLAGGTNGPLPILLRETSRLGPPAFASTPVYPLTEVVTGDANIFDPNIKVPYAQSWTFGIQREISRDMAIEVRYVGTRNLRGWTDYDLNAVENNMVENGTLNEFKLAQRNLEIYRTANPLCGASGQPACNFGFRGLPGQSPLPITLAHFAATKLDPNLASSYSSTLFTNNTFVNTLAFNNPAPGTYAANLHTDAGRRTNALNNGLAKNFFLTNPDLRGGSFFTGNGGYTRYDSLQVEFRRRLSQGLLIQSNYAFAKGFESSRVSFRTGRINTLNGGTPGYVAHSFKLNWVYEVPVGRGKALFGGAGPVLDRVIGGWEFHGTGRVQSGQIVDFGNVNLVGMTRKDLQKAFKVRLDDAAGIAYHLPQDIIDNTIKAFSVSATSATGYGERGAPTGRYIAPANSRSCIQVFSGECAPQNTFVQGPMFTRFDMSAVKRVKITERVNFELRGEFLNAFNNINFLATSNLTNFTNAAFGQVTAAYTDSSNTQDPGGRLIQIVARINF